ncbi:MAG: flavin reductase family protein [Chloroflexi bacterium]|nr:flavin reductase family protein [Chloroflexota bacterium]
MTPKQHITQVKAFFGYYPGLVAVVTVDTGTERNAMAAGWNTALSFVPPLYGVSIAPSRHTHDLILAAGAFGVNFLPLEHARLIAAVGGTSGRDIDKFADFDIATEPSLRANVPILADAYVSYECVLRDHHTYGDHTLFAGEIVAMHVAEGVFAEGVLQPDLLQPALHLGKDRYMRTEKVAVEVLPRGAESFR